MAAYPSSVSPLLLGYLSSLHPKHAAPCGKHKLVSAAPPGIYAKLPLPAAFQSRPFFRTNLVFNSESLGSHQPFNKWWRHNHTQAGLQVTT